jgi:DNA-binding SARP family transcriptional activator
MLKDENFVWATLGEVPMLELRMLGSPLILLKNRPIYGLLAKDQALLFYLALQRRPSSRSVLADLLWPEKCEMDSLTNLRQALYRLRRILPDVLQVNRLTVYFDPMDAIQIDVVRLEEGCAPHNAPAVRRAAVATYVGEFLEGFQVFQAAPFEEWVSLTRERLHTLAVQTLATVVADHSDTRTSSVLAAVDQLLELEPWNEMAHRQKMWLLEQQGRLPAALEHYQRCHQILRQELGIPPEPATTALYEQLRGRLLGRPGSSPLLSGHFC